MNEWVAILTGDIVRSTDLAADERRQLHGLLLGMPKELAREFQRDGPYMVDVFRGDSWQLLVSEATEALRIGLYLRARLRSALLSRKTDTRLGIGIGTADLQGISELGQADGPAFRQSSQALEAVGQGQGMAIELPTWVDESLAAGLAVQLDLLDLPASHWTQKQAEAVARALAGWTQERIGHEWSEGAISQQAVGQHLERAGWGKVERAVDYFEETVARLMASERS